MRRRSDSQTGSGAAAGDGGGRRGELDCGGGAESERSRSGVGAESERNRSGIGADSDAGVLCGKPVMGRAGRETGGWGARGSKGRWEGGRDRRATRFSAQQPAIRQAHIQPQERQFCHPKA